MYLIQQVTADPLQTQTLILPDGSQAQIQLYFRPMQQRWFLQNLTWNNFTLTELAITLSPNFLRPWKNLITFGMACYGASTQVLDPSLQQDFSSGNYLLYILSAAEVQQVEDLYMGLPVGT